MTSNQSPRSHNELAHRFIDNLINNAPDELHDRARDDIADQLEPMLDMIRTLAKLAHDDLYAHMTTRYDDTIPMTDDDADMLSYEFPDACDDAICCQHADELIMTTLYFAHAAYDEPITP